MSGLYSSIDALMTELTNIYCQLMIKHIYYILMKVRAENLLYCKKIYFKLYRIKGTEAECICEKKEKIWVVTSYKLLR